MSLWLKYSISSYPRRIMELPCGSPSHTKGGNAFLHIIKSEIVISKSSIPSSFFIKTILNLSKMMSVVAITLSKASVLSYGFAHWDRGPLKTGWIDSRVVEREVFEMLAPTLFRKFSYEAEMKILCFSFSAFISLISTSFVASNFLFVKRYSQTVYLY